jgi:2-(1,2-epoxy-1,2-dihydrophenyl)acetyl-CoA isomerase
MTEPVLFHREGAVAYIRFNRPARLNAVDLPSSQAFLDCCRKIADSRDIRAVIVSGEGDVFGVGGDLNELKEDPVAGASRLLAPIHEAIKLMGELDAPFIASLHGVVAGGSLSLAMGCDLAIAAEDTKFNLSYVNIGGTCDGSASWSLPRLVGMRNAMGIALMGQTFEAADALRLGMLNLVVPAWSLDSTVTEVARRLAQGPTKAIGRMKRLIRTSLERSLPAQLDEEREQFVANAATEDFRNGIAAFLQKKKPEFQGR